MRADSPPEPDLRGLSRFTSSVRTRIFAALLLASAPGIVFGAVEARRNYQIASRQEALVRNDDAARAAVRLDDLVRAAADHAALVATRREVDDPGPGCPASLRAALRAGAGYTAFARADATGRVVCSSAALDAPLNVRNADWFATLRAGAKRAVSDLTTTPLSGEPALITAVAVRTGARFDGAVFVVLPKSMLQHAVAMELGGDVGAIVAYDRRGALVTAAARNVSVGAAANVAALALASSKGVSGADDLYAQRVSAPGNSFAIVSVAPQRQQSEIGLRAALIVLAPILVTALSLIFVWLALDWWVLRWFYKLGDMAADFGAGRYAPAAMHGAPAEIGDLAHAFDRAVTDARTRERDLATALAANVSLTRELHHRVKNNLQVLASLVSRQQRRSRGSEVREALSEARARMAPVALVYRFINPPEERMSVDVAAYLTELVRQLHVALSGDARGVTLHISAEPGGRSADDATNIGLIVAETMITGYANVTANDTDARAELDWRPQPDGGYVLTIAAPAGAGGETMHQVDSELVHEVARQLNASIKIDAPATVTLTGTAPS